MGLGILVGVVWVPTLAAFTDTVRTSGTTLSAATAFTCAGATQPSTNAWGAWPLNEGAGSLTANDVSGNNHPASYTIPTSSFTDQVAGPCPRDGAKAVTLDGSSAYLYSNTYLNNPQVLSVEIWFRTTTPQGKLIGLGSAQVGYSPVCDRHIYLTPSGNLVFGVKPSSTARTITSPGTYTDGQWHHTVATLAPSSDPNPGMRLYVDGALVASDASTTSAASYSTLSVRIGMDTVSGWPSAPSSYYFKGSLAFAALYTRALTPAEVSAHYQVGR
jgi:hypothetical protein